jgi:hypothetical protein
MKRVGVVTDEQYKQKVHSVYDNTDLIREAFENGTEDELEL